MTSDKIYRGSENGHLPADPGNALILLPLFLSERVGQKNYPVILFATRSALLQNLTFQSIVGAGRSTNSPLHMPGKELLSGQYNPLSPSLLNIKQFKYSNSIIKVQDA